MRVWHARVEESSTSHKLAVPVPLEPKTGGEDSQSFAEEFEGLVPVVSSVSAGPKRRRGNDSVSHISTSEHSW